MQATPTADDVAVAQVNGRPVWGSCVAAQVVREHVTRTQALEECVDFELLAQQADARGLARDPEVIERTHTALVGQLVATAYERGFTKPDEFGAAWDEFVKTTRILHKLRHPEYRASTHVLVPVAKNAPPEVDAAAHALADQIAATVANERGLLGPHLIELAEHVTRLEPCRPGIQVPCQETLQLYPRWRLEAPYADALWAIPEIGRTAGPVRTSFGWDVLVWTDVQLAANPSADEITAGILAEIKPWYFARWVEQLGHDLGLHIARDPGADQLLEASP
jgi:hypothetical protein